MKALILIFLPALTFTAYCHDKADTISFCIKYYSEFKYTEEQKEKFNDINIPEIGRHSSKFYSLRYKLFAHKRDSIKNTTTDSFEYLKFMSKHYGSPKGREYTVYKNIPHKGTLCYTDIIYYDHHFLYREAIECPEWQLTDSDTTIIGYQCQKAVCKFREREWTAWYTKEIPIDNGPWKLGGLSGLILRASESQGIFSFSAIDIEKAKAINTITLDNTNHTQTTPLALQQLIQNFWIDQWNTINSLEGKEYSEPPSAQRKFTACPLEYYR